MKTKFNIAICVLLYAALTSCSTQRYASAQYEGSEDGYYSQNDNYNDDDYYDDGGGSNVNLNLFVNQLSPYGSWMNYPSYGRVWICNEPGFIPYHSNGNWMYTSHGWTWVSNYSWGWAPFHYGRWGYDPFYGWMWVPGYQWGPAWVGWRTGGDYYGWAPLAPGININLGFSFNNMPADRWNFVPKRYITSPSMNRYVVDRSRNVTIINNTTIIKNTNVYRNARYASGPSRNEVERVTGNRINTVRINNDVKPGSTRVVDNKTIQMYRPEIKKVEKRAPERVNRDARSRSIQSSPERNAPVERNVQPQQPVNRQRTQPENTVPQNRTPERTEPVQRNRRPNIADDAGAVNRNNIDERNDNINYDNPPGIRKNTVADIRERNERPTIEDAPNVNRNDNSGNRNARISEQRNNRPEYRVESRNENLNQNSNRRPNSDLNQSATRQPRSYQPAQQTPQQQRVQPQTSNRNQSQTTPGNPKRRDGND